MNLKFYATDQQKLNLKISFILLILFLSLTCFFGQTDIDSNPSNFSDDIQRNQFSSTEPSNPKTFFLWINLELMTKGEYTEKIITSSCKRTIVKVEEE